VEIAEVGRRSDGDVMKHVFPVILIILDLSASVVYFWQRDYARAGYWLSAGFITFSTLFIH